jgi:hypothetical protein
MRRMAEGEFKEDNVYQEIVKIVGPYETGPFFASLT